ncbi:MAG TPA: NAD(P)H-hydrate dehydratase [Terracidiphilus sp.]|nr:NAD(P)H-hydrate dehydratase [Terracidiphilus sp.]
MKVLTAAEMQACDRATTERFGVPSLVLMRHAAAAVAAFAQERFPQARRVTVLCGRGNNGGDGLMTARLLATAGLKVTTLLLGAPETLSGDAAAAWRELASPAHGMIHVVRTAEELAQHNSALETDLLVDAVVGTGFAPPLRGLALAALHWIAACKAPVLAVDLPSGWPSDATDAHLDGPVFPADAVITFTAPKPAHLFGQLTQGWDDPVAVAPIGSPDAAILSEQKLTWAGAAHALVETPRVADGNKGKYGHVLVVGGGVGKAGAPAMASLAAMRAGAGLVTAAVPEPALPTVARFAAEMMTRPLAATATGEMAARGLTAELFEKLTKGITVLAIGPGMGQGAGALKMLTGLLEATHLPVVLDADALNLIAGHAPLLKMLARMGRAGRTVVLTPHPGEMARLADMATKDVQARRLETARGFAEKHQVTLVLKGARTLIAHPDGSVAVNTSGNPAMAKGGSGDMLTGWVAGLLGQYGAEPARAVEAAVYLHGLAADFAVRAADEHTLLATDTLRAFSQAFRFRPRTRSGYVLLQGAALHAVS